MPARAPHASSSASATAAAARSSGLPLATPGLRPRGLERSPLNPVQRLLHLPALLISIGMALFAILIIPWLWRRSAASTAVDAAAPAGADPDAGGAEAAERAALPLCVLVIAASAGLYLASFVGSVRALPVRYVMPIYVVVPVLFALSLKRLARRSPALAGALAAVVLVFNLASTFWPWTAQRRQWAANAVEDQRALHVLEQRPAPRGAGDCLVEALARRARRGRPDHRGVETSGRRQPGIRLRAA